MADEPTAGQTEPTPAAAAPPKGDAKAALRSLFRQREVMTVGIIVIAAVAFHCLTLSSNPETWPSKFANVANLRAQVVPLALDAMVAVGMLLVIISGGFDLSVGSVLALAGIAAGITVNQTESIPLAFAAGLAAGVVAGCVNGLIVTRFGVNPLIATLGMMSVSRGIVVWVIEKGRVVTGFPDAFTSIGQREVVNLFGAEIETGVFGYKAALVALVVVVVGDILLRNSRWLRQIYYVGGNETAARLSGINVEVVRGFTYVACATLAGLSGVLSTAKYGAATAEAGLGLELQAIAACVIGGASLAGGQGTAFGALLGCVLMNVINTGLVCCNVKPAWQQVALGVVLVVAVTFDMWIVRRRRAR